MQVGFRNSLALQTILLVTLVTMVAGVFVLATNSYYSAEKARDETQETIEALITTVEPHLQIATYLNDTVLAASIAEGLSANEIVSSVRIVAQPVDDPNAEQVLIEYRSSVPNNNAFGGVIRRTITSPFDEAVSTGFVEVVRNGHGVDKFVDRAMITAGVPLLVLTFFIIFALLLSVKFALMPFMAQFARQLNSISADTSELLECPEKHKNNEVGALTHYINRMLVRLYEVRENERLLHHQNEIERKKLQAILEKANTGIFLMSSNGSVQSQNPAFVDMVCPIPGVMTTCQQNAAGDFFAVLRTQDNSQADSLIGQIQKGELVENDLRIIDRNGRTLWLHVTLSPIEEGLFQGVLNDVTTHKEELIAAQTIAKTDALTGLANRYAFDAHLEATAASVIARTSGGFALMFIDLDRFKPINDIHGHDAGDHVLSIIAKRLRSCVRETDFVSRFGGDEFVVILHDIHNAEMVEPIAQTIIAKFSDPISFEDRIELQVGASIGVAFMLPEMNINKEILLQNADEAMYKVKEQGRGNYFIHNGAQDNQDDQQAVAS